MKGIAQTYIEPVFDRTDVPSLHINKIEVTKDTTFVHCTYRAEAGSWARISKDTYLYDTERNQKHSLLKSVGLPISPQKREFPCDSTCQILLCFSNIGNATRLDFIEDPDGEAFNIYGIDIHNSYNHICDFDDIQLYGDSAVMRLNNMDNADWESERLYIQKQLNASQYWYGICSEYSAYAMFNFVLHYNNTENWDKAIDWGKNTIDILNKLPQDSLNLNVLARAYTSIGTAYAMKKQIEKGLQYYEKSLTIRRIHKGIGVVSYEELLGTMSRLYYYMENYPKALFYGQELADYYKKKYEEDNYKYQCVYINSLNNLCEFQRSMSKNEEAIETGKRALKLIELSHGECDYALWLKYLIYNNLGLALYTTNQVDEAKLYFEKIVQDADTLRSENNNVVLNAKMLLADIFLYNQQDTIRAICEYESILYELENNNDTLSYVYMGILDKLYKGYKGINPDLSLNYLNKYILVTKEKYGTESVGYAKLLCDFVSLTWLKSLVDYNNKVGTLDTLLSYTQTITKVFKRHINNSIFNMSKTERERYWKKNQELFTWLIPTISGLMDTDEWNSLAYDASLFYKGMLLTSEVEFKKILEKSNDTTLIEQYSDYLRDLSLLEEQYSVKSPTINMDSLKSIIDQKEHALSQKVSWLNRQYDGTNITWQDVRNELRDNDIAIEIVSFKGLLTNASDMYYYAYVIKKKSVAPKLIPLFRMATSRSINYDRLAEQIWGNSVLQEELQNVENIYFSTSGLLNTIGIEYLPITENMNINDKYNLYRLSSTRELCLRREKTRVKNAYLYGGLDYNCTQDNSQDDNTEDVEQHGLSRSVLESLVLRGDFEQLKGSEQEVQQIRTEMANKAIECVTYMGSYGTETSLKKASGTPINIIHLSTHGMFVPIENDSISLSQNFRFMISDEDTLVDEETKALSRSFIVMSGGNNLIHRNEIPQGQEDGILTASEISHLFFPYLDLVVLSACQTALGTLDSEGVYGLQRGFKKAGANTILMTLDKVDDEATKILMVEFYRNLMNGKTKRQSLKDAQKYLREYDNGKYDNPRYWASFIMLDGLD